METVFSPVSGPHTTIILLPWLQPFCLKASFCLVLFHPRFCLPLLVHRDNPCSEDDGWLTRVIEKRSKFRREKPSTHHLTAHMPAPSCLTSTRPCLVKTEEDFEGTPKKMCHYWGWRVTYKVTLNISWKHPPRFSFALTAFRARLHRWPLRLYGCSRRDNKEVKRLLQTSSALSDSTDGEEENAPHNSWIL